MSDKEALTIFLKTPISYRMLQCLVNSTLKVLPCPETAYPTASICFNDHQLPSLFTFITKLVKSTNIQTGTLMATLVYLKRLNEKLPRTATAQNPSTRHRIFLASLILSSKFHNDTSPKNKYWAKFTDGLFDLEDVNEMERHLLLLLDWETTIHKEDLYHVLKEFLDPIKKQQIINSLKETELLTAPKVPEYTLKIKTPERQILSSPTTVPDSPVRSHTSLLSYSSSSRPSSSTTASSVDSPEFEEIRKLKSPIFLLPTSRSFEPNISPLTSSSSNNTRHQYPKSPTPNRIHKSTSFNNKQQQFNFHQTVQFARSVNNSISKLPSNTSIGSLSSMMTKSTSTSSIFSNHYSELRTSSSSSSITSDDCFGEEPEIFQEENKEFFLQDNKAYFSYNYQIQVKAANKFELEKKLQQIN